jgi:hypothetical protein
VPPRWQSVQRSVVYGIPSRTCSPCTHLDEICRVRMQTDFFPDARVRSPASRLWQLRQSASSLGGDAGMAGLTRSARAKVCRHFGMHPGELLVGIALVTLLAASDRAPARSKAAGATACPPWQSTQLGRSLLVVAWRWPGLCTAAASRALHRPTRFQPGTGPDQRHRSARVDIDSVGAGPWQSVQ